MLHNVIIMTGAGVAIFEKVWVQDTKRQVAEKGRLFGSLITTMQEFSRQSTGMVVTYIEFGQVAVSIVDDSRTKLICTLFHDVSDGSDFGKIIATSILRSFLETFSDVSFAGTVNIAMFKSFGSKIYDAITNSVRSILQQLQGSRGIINAIVIHDDGTAVMPTQEEDQLGIVANLQPLLNFSTDILLAKQERPQVITFEMSKQTVFVHKVGDASLLSICRKSLNPSVFMPSIEKAVEMLGKVFSLSNALAKQ